MKKKKHKRSKWVHHVDNAWINEKIGSHGGAYEFKDPKGLAVIGYMGGRNRLQVFGYNIILFFKYIRRIIKRRCRYGTKALPKL